MDKMQSTYVNKSAIYVNKREVQISFAIETPFRNEDGMKIDVNEQARIIMNIDYAKQFCKTLEHTIAQNEERNSDKESKEKQEIK